MHKDKSRTLVLLVPGFPADEEDINCLPAQQRFVRSVNRNFPNLQLVIISFQYPFVSEKYEWFGNSVLPLNGQNKGKTRRLTTWMQAWHTLQKVDRQHDVIGILSFWCGECALIAKYFALRHNLVQFCWISGQDALSENRYVKWIRPKCSTLIAMSSALANEFERNFGLRPAHIVRNGTDESPTTNDLQPRSIDILGAGSLIPLKQYNIFIEVVSKLAMQGITVCTMICGAGIQRRDLQMQIDQLSLGRVVELKGEIPRPELMKLMRQTKIFLHPSRYEGLSSACLEALAAGAHVVSFTDPGEGKIDQWHVVADIDAMTDCVVDIISSSAIEFRAITPFPMDESAKQIIALFSSENY